MEKPDSASQALGSIIRIDEAQVKDHLGEIVRSTVEDTLNSLLDAEAARLLHRSHVLDIKGRSYRLRDLEQAAVSRG